MLPGSTIERNGGGALPQRGGGAEELRGTKREGSRSYSNLLCASAPLRGTPGLVENGVPNLVQGLRFGIVTPQWVPWPAMVEQWRQVTVMLCGRGGSRNAGIYVSPVVLSACRLVRI